MSVGAAPLYATIAAWLVAAIAIAVALAYFLRPRTRALYPGGAKRYLIALLVQTAGFFVPIPVVLVLLLGRPIPPGLDVALAVAAGLAVVLALRALPGTKQLLTDLHRARVEAAMQRMGPKETRQP